MEKIYMENSASLKRWNIMDKEKQIKAIKKRVNKLTRKIKDIESRLDDLEDSQSSKNINSNLGKSNKKSKSRQKKSEDSGGTDHNYLKKTIDNAKRRYENEH